MNNPLIRRLAAFLLGALLLVYVGYQLYNANYNPVQTETADAFETTENVKVTGTAIRKETLVPMSGDGVVSYVIPDGGKVDKGGKVAEIYPNESAATARQQIKELDMQIAQLEKLADPGDTYSMDQESLNKQISGELFDVLYNVSVCDYEEAGTQKEEFLYLVNERQIVTKVTDAAVFQARKQSLQEQRDALAAGSKGTGSVAAPASGYFISKADGFETVFDFSSVLKLTPETLKTALASGAATDGTTGKVCTDFNWYFAAEIPVEAVAKFRVGAHLTVEFPFVTNRQVPVQVAAVNQPARGGAAVVVLSSSVMDAELANLRNETAQIQVARYSGIRVSQKAIRFETITKTFTDAEGEKTTVTQEVEGVYAMRGSEIKFRQIFPLFTSGGYVICDPDPDPDTERMFTDSTIQLYDEVVVEGTDLFNGKVVK